MKSVMFSRLTKRFSNFCRIANNLSALTLILASEITITKLTWSERSKILFKLNALMTSCSKPLVSLNPGQSQQVMSQASTHLLGMDVIDIEVDPILTSPSGRGAFNIRSPKYLFPYAKRVFPAMKWSKVLLPYPVSPITTTDFLVWTILFELYLIASWISSSDFLDEFYYALSIYIYICSG